MVDPENPNELYEWQQSTDETYLRDTLDHASKFYGEVRSFDSTTFPLEGTNLRELFPDIEEGVTHVSMPSYERFDHSIYAEHIDMAGLTVSLLQRDRYPNGARTEPIRFGMGLSNQEGAIFVEFMVASRHWQGYDVMQAQHPPTDDENRAPHALIKIDEGTDISRLFVSAKQRVELSDPTPDQMMHNVDYKKKWGECLDRLEELIATILPSTELELSNEQMKLLDELASLYFFDDPTSKARARGEEDAAYLSSSTLSPETGKHSSLIWGFLGKMASHYKRNQ